MGRMNGLNKPPMQGEAKGLINCHVSTIKIHQQMKHDGVKADTKEKVTDDLPF